MTIITSVAIVLALHVAGTVLLIVSGASMLRLRERRALQWSHVITRLFSVALLAITLLFMAPRVKALLLGFGTPLPHFGELVFKLSDLASVFFPYLLLFGLVAAGAEMMFFESCLRRDEDSQVEFARLCSFLVTIGLGLTLLFCEFGAAMSLIKLANDLS